MVAGLGSSTLAGPALGRGSWEVGLGTSWLRCNSLRTYGSGLGNDLGTSAMATGARRTSSLATSVLLLPPWLLAPWELLPWPVALGLAAAWEPTLGSVMLGLSRLTLETVADR